MNLYSITQDKLMLEKVLALGDSISRMQAPESGAIPTHWTKKDCAVNLENFWINSHIDTAFFMMQSANAVGEI